MKVKPDEYMKVQGILIYRKRPRKKEYFACYLEKNGKQIGHTFIDKPLEVENIKRKLSRLRKVI